MAIFEQASIYPFCQKLYKKIMKPRKSFKKSVKYKGQQEYKTAFFPTKPGFYT